MDLSYGKHFTIATGCDSIYKLFTILLELLHIGSWIIEGTYLQPLSVAFLWKL